MACLETQESRSNIAMKPKEISFCTTTTLKLPSNNKIKDSIQSTSCQLEIM